MVWDVIVSIAEHAAHEDSCDAPSVVRLCCKVDYCNYGPHQNVQARSSHPRSGADIDRKPDEVLYRATAVQNHEDGQNERAYNGGDHTVPPEEANGYKGGTKVV